MSRNPHRRSQSGGDRYGKGGNNNRDRRRVRQRTVASAANFWSALTDDEQESFVAVAQENAFSEGAELWREGQPADHVVVIKSGWAKVCHERLGEERIVAWRGPGHLLGERASERVNLRSATVVAVNDVTTLTVTTDKFAAFLDTFPRVRGVVENQVVQRLAETEGSPPGAGDRPPATGAVSPDLARRLAATILRKVSARDDGDDEGDGAVATATTVPVSVRQLAQWIDEPEGAVTRLLESWQEDGVVRRFQNQRAVIDVDVLQREFGGSGGAAGREGERVLWTGQNCSILLTDIAAFGAEIRSHEDRRVVRTAMYRILQESCEKSGTEWTSCHCEDRGDGALIVVPPSRPTGSVVDMVHNHMAAGLREHNSTATESSRIQLRAALHVGPVVSDKWGVTGEALIHAARMLDAKRLKQRLAETGADLGFITSTFVYDSMIKPGTAGVSSTGYEQVRFQVKESKSAAWMYFSSPPA
jgi:CRP-like cAMP-binding protein